MRLRAITSLLAALCVGGCGAAGPTSPTRVATPITGPRILVAGQSGAHALAAVMPESIDFTNIAVSTINYWLSDREFAERARTAPLLAFVWWSPSDVAMPIEEYTERLRALIAIARSGNGTLPVRIVELADFPVRAGIKEAQRRVATDPGVELIPTADLPCADPACHLTPQGYETVRDRIYRSLGR